MKSQKRATAALLAPVWRLRWPTQGQQEARHPPICMQLGPGTQSRYASLLRQCVAVSASHSRRRKRKVAKTTWQTSKILQSKLIFRRSRQGCALKLTPNLAPPPDS